jgi:hypothetical protein
MKTGDTTADLRQYRNENGRLVHPDPDRVFACPFCDASAPDYRTHPKVDPEHPTRCRSCRTAFPESAVVERADLQSEHNYVFEDGLGEAGTLLWHAPSDTPIEKLSELEVNR